MTEQTALSTVDYKNYKSLILRLTEEKMVINVSKGDLLRLLQTCFSQLFVTASAETPIRAAKAALSKLSRVPVGSYVIAVVESPSESTLAETENVLCNIADTLKCDNIETAFAFSEDNSCRVSLIVFLFESVSEGNN